MIKMEIVVKTFHELTLNELYDVLKLRCEVFVVEQNCVYPDIDGKDHEALHIIGKDDSGIVAYTRCFSPGIYFTEAAIGRVVVKQEMRKFGYGYEIMKASIEALKSRYPTSVIKLSGQTYLIKFYESLGFRTIGKPYLEDGIPHIAMITT